MTDKEPTVFIQVAGDRLTVVRPAEHNTRHSYSFVALLKLIGAIDSNDVTEILPPRSP